MTQASRGRRRGNVFSVRLTDDERARIETAMRNGGGPRSLGPWLLWAALHHALPFGDRADSAPAPLVLELTPEEALTISVALGAYADRRCEDSREPGIAPELARERRDDCQRANAINDRLDALEAKGAR